jgi:hypothetical protein
MPISDIETELRATFVDGVTDIPDDVADRLGQVDYRPRTRRRTAQAGPLAMVAVLGAGGVYALATPGSHPVQHSHAAHPAPQLRLSARVATALADASQDIAHVHVTDASGQVSDDWLTADGNVLHITSTRADGGKWIDETYATTGDTQTATEVNYVNRTWSRTSYPTPQPPAHCVLPECLSAANGGMPPGGKGPGGAPLSTAAVRWLLTKGDFTEEPGTESVAGVTTKKISSTTGGITCTMWIDQETNLPVRVVYDQAGTGPVISSDVSFEPPSADNLAALQVVVPDGFTRVAGQN